MEYSEVDEAEEEGKGILMMNTSIEEHLFRHEGSEGVGWRLKKGINDT